MFKPIFQLAKKLMSTIRPKPRKETFKMDMPKPREKLGLSKTRRKQDERRRKGRSKLHKKELHVATPTSPILPLKRIRPVRSFYSSNRFQCASGLKPIRFVNGKQIGGNP